MAGHPQALIVLDRDGVLNRTVPSATEPRPDSPLRLDQVEVFPWIPAVLRELTDAGFGLVVASNQPAWAKGKITRANLDAVHAAILRDAQGAGGLILSSHLCLHRAEDGCDCRKPATGLLVEAFARHPRYLPAVSWMVGDRATDVQAGIAFGMLTAYLGAGTPEDEGAFAARAIRPFFRGNDLRDFARFVLGRA